MNVTVRKPNVFFSSETLDEDADYVNTTVSSVDKTDATPDSTVRKFSSFIQSVPSLASGTLFWVILVLIMSLRLYFTSVMSENSNKLTTENQELRENCDNLNQNLTDQIQNMMTTSNELNVSRAQWAIDNYCPKNKNVRTCNSCQVSWLNFTSSCYAIHDVKSTTDQKTWEGAREDCRGKNSDLAVIVNESEKKFVTDNSWNNANIQGYWIGLRAENGRWKWADGSFLSNSSWIQTPATNNSCVTSLQNRGWTPVSCDKKNAWICEKQALTV